MPKTYTYDEVSQHRTADSCWVVLYGSVWDVTRFLPSHPGGQKIVLQLAGTDATDEYDPIHPPGTLENALRSEDKLGSFDASTLPSVEKSPSAEGAQPDVDVPLADLLNLDEIEEAATKKISQKAWGYYYSAADDLRSKSFNNLVYQQILLRPRIFVDCTNCDTSTTLLGNKVQVPFFVSPAAMARLGHPDGEAGIAAACGKFGALQIISNNASQTPEQIVAGATSPEQIFGWQLYIQTDRAKSAAMLDRIHALPAVKFICLTLDAPVPGKREHDEKLKNVAGNLPIRSAVQDGAASSTKPNSAGAASGGGGGVGRALFAGTAPDLTWRTTLPWLAKLTKLPIILKGVQTHEDAYLASLHAPQVRGVLLSNHGGRALDTAPPAIHTLLEIRKYCPEILGRKDFEVWVDGGIKRGTDVVKALALGAKGVGLGRAPLFGLGAGGTQGVERVLEIMDGEVKTAMRLLGVDRVEQLGPHHVNARAAERDVYDGAAGLEKLSMWAQAKL